MQEQRSHPQRVGGPDHVAAPRGHLGDVIHLLFQSQRFPGREEVLDIDLLLENLLHAFQDGAELVRLPDPGREDKVTLLGHVLIPVVELGIRLELGVTHRPTEQISKRDETVLALEHFAGTAFDLRKIEYLKIYFLDCYCMKVPEAWP